MISSECEDPPFTEVPVRVVNAVDTNAGEGITGLSVAVTLAWAALGESPEPWATLVTHSAAHVLDTPALTRLLVTEVVTGADLVTVAS